MRNESSGAYIPAGDLARFGERAKRRCSDHFSSDLPKVERVTASTPGKALREAVEKSTILIPGAFNA
ncbi:MAG TPA: hypothetical protein VGJ26_15015, partial [Pirellulales bacterium]